MSLALAAGGLAASEVSERERALEARVGAPVPAVVAVEEIAAGTRLTAGRVARLLAVREVPERFVPPDALASPEEAVGLRTGAPLAPGSYLTPAALSAAPRAAGEPGLARGERALELPVAGGESLTRLAGQGARVDVLVTTEPRAGEGRTFVALENVELLGARPGSGVGADDPGGGGSAPAGASDGTLATLRLSPRQAVYLAAAANFAREVRLLARAAGDRRRVGHPSVDAAGL